MTNFNLQAALEAVLFSSSQPVAVKLLANITGATINEVELSLNDLQQKYQLPSSGLQLLRHDNRVQLVTAAACEAVVNKLQKEELEGELTKPSLETLSVIAYRGPITKLELEQIRGVNCGLIIRNLLLRGLIEQKQHPDLPVVEYVVSFDFLRHLGFNSLNDLPDYERLHSDPDLAEYLKRRNQEQAPLTNDKV